MMEKNKYYGLQVKPDKFESGIVIYNSNSFELNELDVQIVKDTEESSYHRTSKHLAQRKEQRMELTYHWEGNDMMDMFTVRMAEREGVTEHLKSVDQLGWVRKMNNIRSRAEEVVLHDLIYMD